MVQGQLSDFRDINIGIKLNNIPEIDELDAEKYITDEMLAVAQWRASKRTSEVSFYETAADLLWLLYVEVHMVVDVKPRKTLKKFQFMKGRSGTVAK